MELYPFLVVWSGWVVCYPFVVWRGVGVWVSWSNFVVVGFLCRLQVIEKDFSVTVSVSEAYVRLMETDERVRFEVSCDRRQLGVYDAQDEYVGELYSVDREFMMPLLTRYCFADLRVYGEVSHVEEGEEVVVLHVWVAVTTWDDGERAWLNSRYR